MHAKLIGATALVLLGLEAASAASTRGPRSLSHGEELSLAKRGSKPLGAKCKKTVSGDALLLQPLQSDSGLLTDSFRFPDLLLSRPILHQAQLLWCTDNRWQSLQPKRRLREWRMLQQDMPWYDKASIDCTVQEQHPM